MNNAEKQEQFRSSRLVIADDHPLFRAAHSGVPTLLWASANVLEKIVIWGICIGPRLSVECTALKSRGLEVPPYMGA